MVVILIGVAGAGKTTVGRALAAQLGWEFVDADSLHPASNVDKMRRGHPLTDDDRLPWLAALRRLIHDRSKKSADIVLACSALRKAFREKLGAGFDVRFVYLKGRRELLEQRLS